MVKRTVPDRERLMRLAVEMRNAGLSYDEIARRLGVAKSTVARWVAQAKNQEPENESGTGEPANASAETGSVDSIIKEVEARRGEAGWPEAGRAEATDGRESAVIEAVKRVVIEDATPIVKKVILNPKVLMYYDYVKSKGYTGDLGDFISECVEGLFRLAGLEVAVVKHERGQKTG